MTEELAAQFKDLDDAELKTLRDATTSADRACAINAVLAYREQERNCPTPAERKESNYTLIIKETTTEGEDFTNTVILRAEATPYNLNEEDAPRRFYEEDATPSEIAEYERQIAGEDERRAIAQAAEKAGVYFRSETPPSDYSPTGKRYYSAVTMERAGRFIVMTQHSAIDC